MNNEDLKSFISAEIRAGIAEAVAAVTEATPAEQDYLNNEWWTTKNVAHYLGIAHKTAQNHYIFRPDFPEPHYRNVGKSPSFEGKLVKLWNERRKRKN